MAGKYNTTGTLYGEAPGSGKAAEAAHPELSGVDALQLVLDLAGMVPGAGAVPDLINAAISALRGDWLGAGLSLFSAAPGVGDAVGAAKIVKNGEKYLQALKAVETKVIPKLPDWIAKPLQDFVGKARKKLEELMGADKAKPELPKKDAPEPEKPKGKSEDNAQVKRKKRKPRRRCELVPYDELECAPGQEAHHVVPDWMLRMGKRGGTERIPGMPSLAKGPAICLEGGSGNEHNTAHRRTDPVAQRIGKNGTRTGTPGTISLGDTKKVSSRAIEKATGGKGKGGCAKADIQKQLDEQFKAHNDALLRAVKDSWKVTDGIKNAVKRTEGDL